MVGLGDFSGGIVSSTALGVSADGPVVVGSATNGSGAVAFIWDPIDGMRNVRDVLVARGST